MVDDKIYVSLSGLQASERGISIEIYTEEKRRGNLTVQQDGVEYYNNYWNKVVKVNWSQLEILLKDWNNVKERTL